MRVYQILDFVSTMSEMLCLYIFSRCSCTQPRFRSPACAWIPPGVLFVVTWGLTWFSQLGAYKIVIIFSVIILLLKLYYRDSAAQILAAHEIYFTAANILPESIGCFAAERDLWR